MATEIEVTRVDEAAAQRLADATGKVTYLLTNFMTTDRDEAVSWGESVAFMPRPRERELQQVLEQAHRGPSEQEVEAHRMGGNLEELARRTVGERQPQHDPFLAYCSCESCLGERQAGDHYFAAHPSGKGLVHFDPENLDKSEPEPQLRVVRVLEYRGLQKWIENILAGAAVSPTEPMKTLHGVEIVEQIRTTERLCRWCGGEHLGACSEEECSGNPRKGKY